MTELKNFLWVFFLLPILGCTEGVNPGPNMQIEGSVFGTSYHIKYVDDQARHFGEAFDSIFEQTNRSLSTYISNSDISRINRGELDLQVDDQFAEVFAKSLRIYIETGGDFDPTIGKVVNAWGFGPEGLKNPPSGALLDSLMALVGFDKVKLTNERRVELTVPGVYFDFNAIAKGYGVDMIGRYLEGQNINNYLVEIGGEIRARGLNFSNKPWGVGIEQPNFDLSRSIQEVVFLKNESIATSGNYRKFFIDESTGQKYAHTINTKTGYAKPSNLLSASVVSNMDCADVDGYATAFMAMGYEKSKAFLALHPELKAMLIYVDQDNQVQIFKSENLDSRPYN